MANEAAESAGMNNLPTTMIAIRVRQFGGPEALVAESLPLSRPDEGES
jgi:hypothetical protein